MTARMEKWILTTVTNTGEKVGRTWEKILGETWDLNPVSGGRNTETGGGGLHLEQH